jgi:hypothetical protein
MTDPAKSGDVDVDDTNLKFRVKVVPELYSAFVENSNFKTSLTIAQKGLSHTESTQQSSFGKTETHSLVIAPSTINSTGIQNIMDFEYTIGNIQFSADPLSNKYNGVPWTTTTTIAKDKYINDVLLGLPCPYVYGIAGFVQNPVLATLVSCKNKWGGNSQPIDTPVDESLLDTYMRFHKEEDVKAIDRSLLVDDIGEYNKCFGSLFTLDGKLTKTATPMLVFKPKGTTLQEIANHPLNPFVKRNINPSEINFVKTQKSTNYKWDGAKFIADGKGEVFTLNKIVLGNFVFPSNITQEDFVSSGISMEQALFYYDKKNHTALTVVTGTSVDPADDSCIDEPPNQSVTQTLVFKDISAYLPNDELTQFKHSTFHNCGNLIIEKYYRPNLAESMKFFVPWNAPLTNLVSDNGVTSTLNTVNYPHLSDLNLTMVVKKSTIRLRQYELEPILKISKDSTIPYLERNVNRIPLSAQLSYSNGAYRWYDSILQQRKVCSWKLPSQTFPRVPLATIFFSSPRDLSKGSQIYNISPAKRAMTHKLRIKLDSGSFKMVDWTELDFFKFSKDSGLENYDVSFIQGKPVLTPNVLTQTATVGGVSKTVVPQSINAIVAGSNKPVTVIENGNIIVLRWGVHIPLETICASLGGLSSTIHVEGESSCDDPDSNNFDFYMINMYERELVILQNGLVVCNEFQFTRQDFVNAMVIWQKKCDSGRLYINTSALRGGSFFSSIANKVSSFLPKILPAIKSGLDYYNKNSDAIQQGVGALSNAMNGNTTQAMSDGRSALSKLLSN